MVLALCNLCRESVNRAKIRRAGGLLLMLRIIRDSSIASLRSSVLNALVQFMYDEASLQVRVILYDLISLCYGRARGLAITVVIILQELCKHHTSFAV
jgi:hypothetical protein